MRVRLLTLVLLLAAGVKPGSHMRPRLFTPAAAGSNAATSAPTDSARQIDFATELKPIFQARCTPCHFTGGGQYQRLPFDRAETIVKLGPKLFTRIKDEHERQLISEFLTQAAAHSDAHR
jgi:hypothetical protein